MAKLEVKTWECKKCGAEFETESWLGCGGNKDREHRVAQHTFYNLSDSGLPTGLKVNNVSPLRQSVNAKGMTVTIPGKKAQFLNGTFVTDDPEVIHNLELRGFTMTAEQFRELQETDKEKASRKGAELQEERNLRKQKEKELEELKAEIANKGKKSQAA